MEILPLEAILIHADRLDEASCNYANTPKTEEPITVFITQTRTYKVKKSGGGLIKSLLNCGDAMIKSWKTAAFTKGFELIFVSSPNLSPLIGNPTSDASCDRNPTVWPRSRGPNTNAFQATLFTF